MAGRHSKHGRRRTQLPEHHTLRAFAIRIPEQQRQPYQVGITDAHTHVEHLISDESVVAQRHKGHYRALCGTAVLAASLTDPGRGWCRACTQ
jgi:hypothetical protein